MRSKKGTQDYLRGIYELDEGKGVKNKDIAFKLKVNKASVSEMIKKLAYKGLVKREKYSKIELTKKGKKKAIKFFNKHLIIKNFIKKTLEYDNQKAEKEAHLLEHAFSQESIDKIKQLIKVDFIPDLRNSPSYVG